MDSSDQTKVNNMNVKLDMLCEEVQAKLAHIQSMKEMQDTFNKKKLEHLQASYLKQSELSFHDLNSKTEKLVKLYKSPSVNVLKGDGDFFYQKNIEDFFTEEESFTSTLTEYTRKQFFDGIADLAGAKDKSKYALLDSSKQESFLIRGETGDVKHQDREEIIRLQSQYSKSESNRINAGITCVKYKKAVEIAQRQRNILSSRDNFDVTNEQLGEMIEKFNNEIILFQRNLSKQYTTTLLPLLAELQSLNSTKIIKGDYDLKIARQDYLISKQNEVIVQLLLKFSRSYFLTILYEIELQKHRNSYHLLTTSESLVTTEIENIQKRKNMMSDPLFAALNMEKQIITSTDEYMNRIYEAVIPKTSFIREQLYRSYNDLLRGANNIAENVSKTRKELKQAEGEKLENFQLIETTLKSAENILTATKEKSSEELSTVILDVEENLSIAESQINEIIQDLILKKNILSNDKLVEIKRTIFSDFFNDPARLKRNFEELISRVEAYTLSGS